MHWMMKKTGLILSVLSLVLGCGQPATPTAPAPAQAAKEVVPEPPLKKLEATLKDGALPNQFQVELSWPAETKEAENWILVREDSKEGRKPIATLPPDARRFEDTHVVAGETYEYTLGHFAPLDPKFTRTTASVSISLPRDLEIQGRRVFREIRRVHRLFLRAGSVLAPSQTDLNVSVDEIISDQATLEALLPANVVVRAKRAQGELRLHVVGQTGAPGKVGAAGQPGLQGYKGFPGELMDAQSIETMFNGTRIKNIKVCKTAPGRGGPGGTGMAGNPGSPGGPGGQNARVYIEVQTPTGFKLDSHPTAGPGGVGGEGGPGGPGGLGGEPGDNPDPALCPSAVAGPAGLPGPKGPQGPEGPAGERQPFCFRQANTEYGNCEKFPVPPEDVN